MIKAKLLNELNGRQYFILGLSDIEIAKLRDGIPLGLIMEEFGYDKEQCPDTIVLVHAKTYQEVQQHIVKIKAHKDGLIFPAKKDKPETVLH